MSTVKVSTAKHEPPTVTTVMPNTSWKCPAFSLLTTKGHQPILLASGASLCLVFYVQRSLTLCSHPPTLLPPPRICTHIHNTHKDYTSGLNTYIFHMYSVYNSLYCMWLTTYWYLIWWQSHLNLIWKLHRKKGKHPVTVWEMSYVQKHTSDFSI